jgi:hypothetical protein
MQNNYVQTVKAAHDYLVEQEEIDSAFLTAERHEKLNEIIDDLKELYGYLEQVVVE